MGRLGSTGLLAMCSLIVLISRPNAYALGAEYRVGVPLPARERARACHHCADHQQCQLSTFLLPPTSSDDCCLPLGQSQGPGGGLVEDLQVLPLVCWPTLSPSLFPLSLRLSLPRPLSQPPPLVAGQHPTQDPIQQASTRTQVPSHTDGQSVF
jgi:hypothetical protein